MELSVYKVGPEAEPILRNLIQHYCHDMAEWFEIDTLPDGSYPYDTARIWERGRDVYLAKLGDSLAGFALVGPGDDWLGESGHDMREFCVLRRYRRNGLGEKMARRIWDEHPGAWVVRVLEANTPAVAFWRRAISSRVGFEEEQRLVKGRAWRFFRFVA